MHFYLVCEDSTRSSSLEHFHNHNQRDVSGERGTCGESVVKEYSKNRENTQPIPMPMPQIPVSLRSLVSLSLHPVAYHTPTPSGTTA
jgi:hypothetical protein